MPSKNPLSAIIVMQSYFATQTKTCKLSEILAPSHSTEIQIRPAKLAGVCERETYDAIMAEILPLVANLTTN